MVRLIPNLYFINMRYVVSTTSSSYFFLYSNTQYKIFIEINNVDKLDYEYIELDSYLDIDNLV